MRYRIHNLKSIVISISFLFCFLGGVLFQKKRDLDTVVHLQEKRDSLEMLTIFRDEESLPYYNMTKDSLLKLLPMETWKDSVTCIYDGAKIGLSHGAYNIFQNMVKGTNDTFFVQEYFWNVPFSEKRHLYIVFSLQKDSVWVAKSCAQWNPDKIYLD